MKSPIHSKRLQLLFLILALAQLQLGQSGLSDQFQPPPPAHPPLLHSQFPSQLQAIMDLRGTIATHQTAAMAVYAPAPVLQAN